jgi:hypothetical protein
MKADWKQHFALLRPVGTACLWDSYPQSAWSFVVHSDGSSYTPLPDCAAACEAESRCTGFETPVSRAYCALWYDDACSSRGSDGLAVYVDADHVPNIQTFARCARGNCEHLPPPPTVSTPHPPSQPPAPLPPPSPPAPPRRPPVYLLGAIRPISIARDGVFTVHRLGFSVSILVLACACSPLIKLVRMCLSGAKARRICAMGARLGWLQRRLSSLDLKHKAVRLLAAHSGGIAAATLGTLLLLTAVVLTISPFDVPVDPSQFRVVSGRYTDRADSYSAAAHTRGGEVPRLGKSGRRAEVMESAAAVDEAVDEVGSAAGVLEVYYTAADGRSRDNLVGWEGGISAEVIDRIRAAEDRLRAVSGFEAALTSTDSVVSCLRAVPPEADLVAQYAGIGIGGCAQLAAAGSEACEPPFNSTRRSVRRHAVTACCGQ